MQLEYDPYLSRENSWRLGDDQRSIIVRIRVAAARELSFSIRLRRGPILLPEDKDRYHASCLDGTHWRIESARHHEDLPHISLLLTNAPEHVSSALRAMP